ALKHRARLGALAARRDGSVSLDRPGGRAVREYGRLRIETRSEHAAPPADAAALVAGGRVEWAGWTFRLGEAGAGALKAPAPAAGDLQVRARRPGGRLGGRLRIKVEDLFTNAKVPDSTRAGHPLVG